MSQGEPGGSNLNNALEISERKSHAKQFILTLSTSSPQQPISSQEALP